VVVLMQTHVLLLVLGAALLAIFLWAFLRAFRLKMSVRNVRAKVPFPRGINVRAKPKKVGRPKLAMKWRMIWAKLPKPSGSDSASIPSSPKANAKASSQGQILPALPQGEKVQFTCGYPGAVSASQWYSVLLYIHLTERAQYVRSLLDRQSAEIGSGAVASGAVASRTIERGTTLKLVPNLKGFRLNPSTLELDWFEDVQQVRFRIMAGDELAGSSRLGAIDVYAAGLLIAQVPLSIRVRQPGENETAESQIILARMFEKVFASYSHKDKAVVDACCALSRSMGISMFVDSALLLSGDDWKTKLRETILGSDVFQLFWSSNSSASTEVEKEWRTALGLVGEKTERFIRPLYWQQPLPAVPSELNAFHFALLPLENMIELLSKTETGLAENQAAGKTSS
jgi:TIR domain-containing protein